MVLDTMVRGEDRDDNDERVLETDPKGRFQKTDQLLGQGAFKWVYKGYDTDEAREVAWNELKTIAVSKRDRIKFQEEVNLLREFRHPNLLIFYDWWVADSESKVKCNGKKVSKFVFITELMTSGTLKQYVRKVNSIRPQAIQNWCRQILNGLNYLHKNNIIHRDLKCDNVFINGANNIIKV
ncbi:hypothetical protein SARC_00874 [Sphaeroforma arctica JP610]|uniref:Protein kinase domain-containing protein n=1 Tax=Sphaeroforma arctica JP610 TaxID=667725 RepID=A0A0L0GDL2_9EUKA|nr:hypothetical protein SARC_00874 [Sphaeroforma arctica JP610]KNC86981.1 hypothetical protein SARC_00874 [Sphaeroforma arctica JP610]|eukprot:XP_014160883.1 hypothetical protein SARC_00874 [Sphaeroforma arctica JP610]